MIMFANLCLVFTVLHGLAPPLLEALVLLLSNTRSTPRGDIGIPLRYSTFGQNSYSVEAFHGIKYQKA